MDRILATKELNEPLVVKAIFFDLDNTLCDNLSATTAAAEDVTKYVMSHFPYLDRNIVRSTYDKVFAEQELDTRELLNQPNHFADGLELRRARFERLQDELGLAGHDVREQLVDLFGKSKLANLRVFAEVPSILSILKTNFVLGIITNGFVDLQLEELRALNLESYFTHLVVSQEVGARKPNPEIFMEAVRRVSEPVDRVLMIGDNHANDIVTPKRLGMHAGLVLHSKKRPTILEEAPDFIIQDLYKLPTLVSPP